MHNKSVFNQHSHYKKPLAFLALLAFIAMLLSTAPARPQSGAAPISDTASITVYATGTASARPDMALLQVSVSHEAKTAKQALDQTNSDMAKIMAALKSASIAADDMQTTGLDLQPVYQSGHDESGKREKSGYQANNTLQIKVHDLGRLGVIIDAAISNGANGLGQMSLTNAKPQPLYDAARKDAVANALSKAKLYADAAGVSLGRVLNIEEKSSGMELMARATMSAAPIAAGTQHYTVNLALTMELINTK